jgi:hypothetical protein
LKPGEDAPTPPKGLRQESERTEKLDDPLPFQAFNLYLMRKETFLPQQFSLHPFSGADKFNPYILALFLQIAGYGQGWKDVSSRSPSSNEDFHLALAPA